MVNFAILGCGTIAEFHAMALENIAQARLVGAWDAMPAVSERFARMHGICAYKSMEEMLKDEQLDAVCVCTPSGFHAQQALAVIACGKHVALEKPMCLTLAQADEILRMAEKQKVQVCVISQLRFSPHVQAIKRAMDSHAFGKLVSGSLAMKYYRSQAYYASSAWRGTWEMDGGGALMNQGIHGVDLLQYLMGDVRAVTAVSKTQTHAIQTEDSVIALMEFCNGAIGTLEASTTCFPGYPRRLELCGDHGSVVLVEDLLERWDLSIEKPSAFNSGIAASGASDPKAVGYEGHQRQLNNLVNAILGKEILFVDAAQGRKPLQIILSIYESAQSGKRIVIEP